jgi:hypothetical protein
MVKGGCFPRIKLPGCDAEGTAEVKKTWIYTSSPPYVFVA